MISGIFTLLLANTEIYVREIIFKIEPDKMKHVLHWFYVISVVPVSLLIMTCGAWETGTRL
jgi:hypothetical protein